MGDDLAPEPRSAVRGGASGRASRPGPRAGRGGPPSGARLLRRQPRIRPEHDARQRPLLPGRRPGPGGIRRPLPEPCRGAAPPRGGGGRPALRSLGPELDALEREMLSAYRPPASIDRHPQFIAASSALKTARELDAAGLRYGALLRYLQATLRFAAVREPARSPSPPSSGAPFDASGFARKREESRASLREETTAWAASFSSWPTPSWPTDPPQGAATAAAVVNDVLPRYFAALGPAPARGPAPGAASHRHPRALALHLKPLRPGRSAGARSGGGVSAARSGSGRRTTATRPWPSASG